jgi:3-oxoacyl-[acyl-carrier-protein] synthase-3
VKRPFVYLAGVGRCSPEHILRNNDFAAMGLDTNDEWIVQRTGIRERRIAGPDENNRTMSARPHAWPWNAPVCIRGRSI